MTKAGASESRALTNSEQRSLDQRRRSGKMGRPIVLTDELTERICKHIRIGNRPHVAGSLEGVPHRTFFSWKERGEADDLDEIDSVFRNFLHKIEAAQGTAESRAVQALVRGMIDRRPAKPDESSVLIPGDHRAALAWLSRARDGWQERKEITGANGQPLFAQTGFEELTDDDLDSRLAELRAATGVGARTPAARRTRSKASPG